MKYDSDKLGEILQPSFPSTLTSAYDTLSHSALDLFPEATSIYFSTVVSGKINFSRAYEVFSKKQRVVSF